MNRTQGSSWLIVVCLALIFLLCASDASASKRRRGAASSNMLQKRETNPMNFVRLFVMRLVYGIAKMVGLSEPLSEVLDGAFVPPGEDDDDDYGGDYF